ncbi:MAG: gliding motility-associated-like protein [Bacteroidia bacterium]
MFLATSALSQGTTFICDEFGNLYKVNPSFGCSSQLVGNMNLIMADIAYNPTNSKLYGVTLNRTVVEINTNTGESTFIFQYATSFPTVLLNALVCDNQGRIYAASGYDDSLYEIDIVNMRLINLGSMGTSLVSAGDLTFFSGEMYLAAFPNELVKVNIETPNKSEYLGSFLNIPNELAYGITTVYENCEEFFYAFSSNNVFLLKKDNLLDANPLCNNIISGEVYGATSSSEFTPDFDVEIIALDIPCDVTSIELEAHVTDPSTSISYLWNTGETSQNITASSDKSYWVEVKDGLCESKDTLEVVFFKRPNIDLGIDFSACVGDFIELDAQNLGSEYLWSDNSILQKFNFKAQNLGVNTIWVKAGNAICSDADTISININPLPSIDFGADQSTCIGDTILLDAGNMGASFLWSDNSNNQILEVTESGIYTVTVDDGCLNSDTILITYVNSPSVDLGEDVEICLGDTVKFNAGSGFASYLWSAGQTTPSVSLLPTISTKYSVVVVNNIGCAGFDTVEVKINTLPKPDLGSDLNICEGTNEIILAPSGFVNYIWTSDGDTILATSNPQEITLSEKKEYSLIVTDSEGCVSADTIEVLEINSRPTLNLPDSIIINCLEDFIELDAGVFDSYIWNTGNNSQTIRASNPGLYSVFVQDFNGCSNSDSVLVIITCGIEIIFPDAFSPNGDNKNDLFLPKALNLDSYEMTILDRWGNIVFRTSNLDIGWDGYFNGKPMPSGVYPFKSVYTGRRNGQIVTETKAGSLLLLR